MMTKDNQFHVVRDPLFKSMRGLWCDGEEMYKSMKMFAGKSVQLNDLALPIRLIDSDETRAEVLRLERIERIRQACCPRPWSIDDDGFVVDIDGDPVPYLGHLDDDELCDLVEAEDNYPHADFRDLDEAVAFRLLELLHEGNPGSKAPRCSHCGDHFDVKSSHFGPVCDRCLSVPGGQ